MFTDLGKYFVVETRYFASPLTGGQFYGILPDSLSSGMQHLASL